VARKHIKVRCRLSDRARRSLRTILPLAMFW